MPKVASLEWDPPKLTPKVRLRSTGILRLTFQLNVTDDVQSLTGVSTESQTTHTGDLKTALGDGSPVHHSNWDFVLFLIHVAVSLHSASAITFLLHCDNVKAFFDQIITWDKVSIFTFLWCTNKPGGQTQGTAFPPQKHELPQLCHPYELC